MDDDCKQNDNAIDSIAIIKNALRPDLHISKIGMCSKCKEMCFVDDSCCGVSVIVDGEHETHD